ncbi:MAG: hypothetical protein KDB90_16220 [Planctomycetes bacterium]|nr:hypothetical protein [Planctomycetota bacterium]
MRTVRKIPFNAPSDLHGHIGALQLEVRVDMRHANQGLTSSAGSGSVIFSGENWETDVLWTAVQVLEHDLGRDKDAIIAALGQIIDRLKS